MLNEFSQGFADRLFAAHPEWRKYVDESADAEVLAIEVPSPNGCSESGLRLYTDDDEVTVGFDRFHSHFFGREDEEIYDAALAFIDGILSEAVVVLVYHEGERWAKSMCVDVNDPWPLPEPGQTRVVRSWKGTLDAELAG
jgi:hypothetical protein